jgi:hypothetical protein
MLAGTTTKIIAISSSSFDNLETTLLGFLDKTEICYTNTLSLGDDN